MLGNNYRLTLGNDHRVFVLRRQITARAHQRPSVGRLGHDVALGGKEGLDGDHQALFQQVCIGAVKVARNVLWFFVQCAAQAVAAEALDNF